MFFKVNAVDLLHFSKILIMVSFIDSVTQRHQMVSDVLTLLYIVSLNLVIGSKIKAVIGNTIL